MRAPILLAPLLALAAAAGQEDARPAGHRLGLFIGIDRYPRIEGGDLDGCVNDVRHLRELFRARFGFERSALLGLAIHCDEPARSLRLYSPTALPDPEVPAADRPDPVLELSCADPARAAERLAEHLLHMARVRRLLSLEHEVGRIEPVLEAYEEVEGARRALDRPAVDGIQRFRAGDPIAITFRNRTRRPLYVSLLQVDLSRPEREGLPVGAALVYPGRSSEVRPVPPRGELRIPHFRATAEVPLERTHLKLIATSERMDFRPLLESGPGLRGAPATRGAVPGQSLYDLLDDVLGEGTRTRGCAPGSGDVYWTTADLLFDVEQ